MRRSPVLASLAAVGLAVGCFGDLPAPTDAAGGSAGAGAAGGNAGTSAAGSGGGGGMLAGGTSAGGSVSAGAGGTAGAGGAAGSGGTPCGGDAKRCGGTCVPLTDPSTGCDSASCEPCELPNAVATCEGGCVVGACVENFADCSNSEPGCETDLRTDPNHCGECAKSCMGTDCVNKQCGRRLVVKVQQAAVHDLKFQGDQIYYVTAGVMAAEAGGKLMQVSVDGGTPTQIGEDMVFPWFLEVTSSDAFVSDRDARKIVRFDLNSGMHSTIATYTIKPGDLALAGDQVWVAAGSEVHVWQSGMANIPTVRVTGQGAIFGIHTQGQQVFWTDTQRNEVRSVPMAPMGSATTLKVHSGGALYGIAGVGPAVAWAYDAAGQEAGIHSYRASLTAKLVDAPKPRFLKTSGNWLYYSTETSLHALSLVNAEVRTLDTTLLDGWAVDVSQDSVFVADRQRGEIYRYPLL